MQPVKTGRGDHERSNQIPPAQDRRDFLKRVSAISTVGAVSKAVKGNSDDSAPQKLPQIRLGEYSLSRLICGTNCFAGHAHLSPFANRSMKEYFTTEQILRTLRRCQEVGINTYQAGEGFAPLYHRFITEGGKMHFIAIAATEPLLIQKLAESGCIAIAHHGEVSDRMFKTGRLDDIQDYLKRIRDAGLLVGISTHMPDVVDAVESKGWDIDYYMTCLYERNRSREALEQLLGQAPIPVGEVYLPNDPRRMFKVINHTKRPCLAFKILAAGRLCDRAQQVEYAFSTTLRSIKPSDGVIVGMFDRYSDQPAENAKFTRQFGSTDQMA